MKFIRRILVLMGLFFTLYFFGDFRVNDVNVRDFLQSKITLQQMKNFGRQAADLFQMLAELIRNKTAALGDGKSGSTDTSLTGQDASLDAAQKMIQDSLSDADRKKILKIFEQNITTDLPDKKGD